MSPDSYLPSARKPIVSIVDDDEGLRGALTDLLDSAGWDSQSFGSSEQFLSSNAPRTSDVIIVDIHMGAMDGLELLNWIRKVLGVPVPVIVVTAMSDSRLEDRAVAEGCYAFIRKPFNPDTLLAHVRGSLTAS
jgi:FixJ family two-component response regulator